MGMNSAPKPSPTMATRTRFWLIGETLLLECIEAARRLREPPSEGNEERPLVASRYFLHFRREPKSYRTSLPDERPLPRPGSGPTSAGRTSLFAVALASPPQTPPRERTMM